MQHKTELTITPESDVKVLLGRKPFPQPLTHLSIEIDTVDVHDGDSIAPILTYISGQTLKVFNREQLRASTGHYLINKKTRTVRLLKKDTVIHSAL